MLSSSLQQGGASTVGKRAGAIITLASYCVVLREIVLGAGAIAIITGYRVVYWGIVVGAGAIGIVANRSCTTGRARSLTIRGRVRVRGRGRLVSTHICMQSRVVRHVAE